MKRGKLHVYGRHEYLTAEITRSQPGSKCLGMLASDCCQALRVSICFAVYRGLAFLRHSKVHQGLQTVKFDTPSSYSSHCVIMQMLT